MPVPKNNKSRQRVTRVLITVDNWLQKQARINRANKKDSFATEINRILNETYTQKTGNDPHTGKSL